MPRLVYVGPIDTVEVPLIGRTLTRGEEFDVADDDTAAALLDQPDNYQPAED
jgi:hypothetical protein